MEALRADDKARAKEILTHLLKSDQNNPEYWIWLSAAVDTAKERSYCLQTALKLDPENGVAKRGLILMGVLAPNEDVRPFPLNHPRAWEEKLLLDHEQSKAGGAKGVFSNPVLRLAGILVAGGVVCGLAVLGLLTPRASLFRPFQTITPGASPTFSPTPTLVYAAGRPLPTFIGPTPLAVLLGVSYTPTPLYVNTPRPPLSQDQFRAAMAASNKGDWADFISNMQLIESLEPEAADIPYYIGEGYRMEGDFQNAFDAYTQALHLDSHFAPAYLGLARARLLQDANANVTQLFDAALQNDPNYGEVYLERANYSLYHNQPDQALPDLDEAAKLMPDSALVQLGYARTYLAMDEPDKGLAAAQKANQIDLTLLAAYSVLGQAYMENGQTQEAIKPLETYLNYQSDDGSAYAELGQAYVESGSYQAGATALTQAISLDPTLRSAYLYRGEALLELNSVDEAQGDFKKAIDYFPDSFDAYLGLTRTSYLQEHFGDAYLQILSTGRLAQTDEQKALVLYWTALIQEKRNQPEEAASNWQELLSMPASAMTSEMRSEATQHLQELNTPTPSSTPVPVLAATSTPKVKTTLTTTPTPGSTRTITPTATSTPTPTETP